MDVHLLVHAGVWTSDEAGNVCLYEKLLRIVCFRSLKSKLHSTLSIHNAFPKLLTQFCGSDGTVR